MKYKTQRMVFIGLGMLCLAVAAALMLNAFKDNVVFFYSPTELQTQPVTERVIRVGGLVKTGSIRLLEDKKTTEFVITDLAHEITVRYTGILPNLFREEQGMVARGMRVSADTLLADELLAKHDENYMPPEVAKALKKSGQWKPE